MLPPTPTPMPVGTPIPINFHLDAGFWDMAPRIVGLWGLFSDYTPVLQIALLGLLLTAMVWTLIKLLRGMSEEEA